MHTIYTLSDPRNNEVRYVGKTMLPIERRLARHLNAKKHHNQNKWNWFSELKSQGLLPVIEEIAVASDENWKDEERFYISYLRFLGCNLLNLLGGGQGDRFKLTEEQIRKSIEGRRNGKGFIQSEYNKKRLAEAREERKKRGWFSDEIKKRYSIEKREHLNSIRHLALNRDHQKKAIIQYDKQGNEIARYAAVRDAAKALNVNHQNIMFVLKGKGNTAYGYVWKYANK